jgi:uncharacterized coiled-coil protein SlyX
MSSELLAFLGAVGGTLGGVIIALITQRGMRGKNKADETKVLTDIALDLLKPYQDEQAKLLKRIEILEYIVDVKDGTIKERDFKIAQQATQIANLETKVCQLEAEVQALRGQIPDWRPGDGDRRQG